MEFGVFLLMQSPRSEPSKAIYQRAIQSAQAADRLGFDRLWLAEHHFTNYSYSASPFTLLAYLAARTERIRLGTAIVQLPLHNPLLVAERAATVDVLSGGRFDLGVGAGYQEYQFERLNVAKNKDFSRYHESLDIVVAALSGKSFTYNGEYFQIPDTYLVPQPMQKNIPIWLVVNTTIKESVQVAINRNLHIFTGALEPMSKLTNMQKVYPSLCKNYSNNHFIGTQRPVYVTQSKREAVDVIEQLRWNVRVGLGQRRKLAQIKEGCVITQPITGEPTTEQILDDHVVVGTPEQCISQIQRLQRGLGINYFGTNFCFGDMSQKQVLASMELFAKEVMPVFSAD